MSAHDLLAELNAAGLTASVCGDCLVIQPASRLTEEMRAALREAKAELLTLLCRLDPNTSGLNYWRARLLHLRWPGADVETHAARLLRRDQDGDDRVNCAGCLHYRYGHCDNFRRAGLNSTALSYGLASLLQRCPGYEAENAGEA